MTSLSQENHDQVLKKRVVVIDGVIEDNLGVETIARMLFLQDQAPDEPIFLFLDSPGGSSTPSLAIMDLMDDITSPVHTFCYGQAGGMATLILAHGDKGNRHATSGALLSLNAPALSQEPTADAQRLLQQLKQQLVATLAQDIGKPEHEALNMLEKNQRFTAVEAQREDLVDKCIPAVSPLTFQTEPGLI